MAITDTYELAARINSFVISLSDSVQRIAVMVNILKSHPPVHPNDLQRAERLFSQYDFYKERLEYYTTLASDLYSESNSNILTYSWQHPAIKKMEPLYKEFADAAWVAYRDTDLKRIVADADFDMQVDELVLEKEEQRKQYSTWIGIAIVAIVLFFVIRYFRKRK